MKHILRRLAAEACISSFSYFFTTRSSPSSASSPDHQPKYAWISPKRNRWNFRYCRLTQHLLEVAANTISEECIGDGVTDQMLPAGFMSNTIPFCGMNWAQRTPLTNLSTCCSGPVMVAHDCFQYCRPKEDNQDLFTDCMNQTLHLPKGPFYATLCNTKASSSSRTTQLSWKAIGLTVLLLVNLVSASCSSNAVAINDVPAAFTASKIPLCGFSYAQQTPFTNVSTCCTDLVKVSHGCFQYCRPEGDDQDLFSQCIDQHVPRHIQPGVLCNAKISSSSGIAEMRWKAVGLSMLLLSAHALF